MGTLTEGDGYSKAHESRGNHFGIANVSTSDSKSRNWNTVWLVNKQVITNELWLLIQSHEDATSKNSGLRDIRRQCLQTDGSRTS